MLELKYHDISIQVSLSNGIYLFPCSSADGKTYLSNMLKSLGAEDRVNSYTFDDKAIGSVTVLLDSSKYDLILLDRYDLYFGDGLNEMQEFAKTGVVLIDCKSHTFPFSVRSCFLDMQSDKMVVFG